MASVFTRIIRGELPAHKVAENERFIAILDIQPLVMGHVLVIPKEEIDYVFDLEDEYLGELMVFSKKVATSLKKTIPCLRIVVSIIGLEVPHVHVHLIPVNKMDDCNFSRPKLRPEHSELAVLAARISAQFAADHP